MTSFSPAPFFKALLCAGLAALVLVGGVTQADPEDLPDIGSPAQTMLTLEDE